MAECPGGHLQITRTARLEAKAAQLAMTLAITSTELQTFLELARIAKAVYAGPTNQRLYPINGERLQSQRYVYGTFYRGFCRVMWNDDDIVVVFRGTRERLLDFGATNLLAWPCSTTSNDIVGRSRIHWGVRNALRFTDRRSKQPALERLADLIEPLLDRRRLFITGHSLGGALAVLGTFFLSQRLRLSPAAIVTFGAPPVGDQSFRQLYSHNDSTWQVVYEADWVPHMPPFFYCHVGQTLWIESGNISREVHWRERMLLELQQRSRFRNFLADHSIDNYIDALTAALFHGQRGPDEFR